MSGSYLKILGATEEWHAASSLTEDPQILGASVQILFVRATGALDLRTLLSSSEHKTDFRVWNIHGHLQEQY
jgi:hypothetical protein